MSAEKRSVMTDALQTLGASGLDETAGRDAIHLAVEPVIAKENLAPGQHIGLIDGKASYKAEKKLGIVDPFGGIVLEGQRFWLIVYPRQITSLRHVWSHPDFEEEKIEVKQDLADKMKSEYWLRDWCANTEGVPGYDNLIAVFTNGEATCEDRDYYGNVLWRIDGEYLHGNGIDAHGEIPNAYEVKHHLEIVTGRKILSMPQYFSCSC